MTDSLRTVSAALAYDSPDTGETLILVVHQAIHLPHLPRTDTEDELLIPLSLDGVVSIFWTRKPTIQEYKSCPHYELTADTPKYNPLDGSYAQQEEAMAAWVARLAQRGRYACSTGTISFHKPQPCYVCLFLA